MHAALHSEPARVLAAAIGALAISYTGIMDGLRMLLLVLSCIYAVIKIVKACRNKPAKEEDEE